MRCNLPPVRRLISEFELTSSKRLITHSLELGMFERSTLFVDCDREDLTWFACCSTALEQLQLGMLGKGEALRGCSFAAGLEDDLESSVNSMGASP
jgi:hypothetical protein